MNFFGVQYCISSLQRKSKNNLCTFSHLVPCRVGSFDNLDSPMASCGGYTRFVYCIFSMYSLMLYYPRFAGSLTELSYGWAHG